MIRLHVPDDLGPGAQIAPAAPQAHYLLNVMRLKAGDELLLFNGRDGEWRARLAMTGKRGCRLDVEASTRPQAASPDVELIVALVKRARLESIVEKAAELGCARVRLVLTARTNAERTRWSGCRPSPRRRPSRPGGWTCRRSPGPDKLGDVLDGWQSEQGPAPDVLRRGGRRSRSGVGRPRRPRAACAGGAGVRGSRRGPTVRSSP